MCYNLIQCALQQLHITFCNIIVILQGPGDFGGKRKGGRGRGGGVLKVVGEVEKGRGRGGGIMDTEHK